VGNAVTDAEHPREIPKPGSLAPNGKRAAPTLVGLRNRLGLKLDKEVKIGDLIQTLTIFVSVISVLISWNIDRKLRISQEANGIRQAAAATLADLEKWKDLSLFIFDELQPVFVETSEIVVEAHNPEKYYESSQRARDYFWRKMNDIINAKRKTVTNEKLEQGYTKLFAYYPAIRLEYIQTLDEMDRVEDITLKKEFAQIEAQILTFAKVEGRVESAQIGNALRKTSKTIETNYARELAVAYSHCQNFLVRLIEAKDSSLIAREAPPL
jgi:hypothetical protein